MNNIYHLSPAQVAEINGLCKADLKAALKLGWLNRHIVDASELPQLDAALELMEARLYRFQVGGNTKLTGVRGFSLDKRY